VSRARFVIVLLASAALITLGLPAGAGHEDDPRTRNLHPMGHIVEPASLLNPAVGNPDIHTDIAFWGKYAFQGNWDGFNIRDISAPGNPRQVSRTFCNGDQGDVVVWDDVLVRSWNTAAPADNPATPQDETRFCDGEAVPAGFEGLHVFDISDLSDPALVASVDLAQGSHTATGVPDLANGRLLIFNSASNAANPGIDIVEVPLDAPENAAFLRFEPAGRSCHDTGVILGDVNLAACAGHEGWTLWDISGNLEDPVQIHSQTVPSVTIGHSAAFSFDGDTLVFGHEPGGGVDDRCKASDPESDRSFFFYDVDGPADDGTPIGTLQGSWVLPRPQSDAENCSLHNYNVVPLRSGRDVLVHGSYQSGTSVVDFTDRENAVELAWSDPPPIPVTFPTPFCQPPGCELGGVWSSYWYNNLIYETNITEGLNIFRFSGKQTAGARRLGHLNPQTQEFSIE
jgi:hypothetical protein